jgi:hypothetical protein
MLQDYTEKDLYLAYTYFYDRKSITEEEGEWNSI